MKNTCHTILLGAILSCFAFISTAQTNEKNCTPNGYVQTFKNKNGTKSKIATYWLYDKSGRIVADSLQAMDTLASIKPYSPVYYRYLRDVVIGAGSDGRKLLIKFNADTLPLLTYDSKINFLYADYDTSGKLNRVQQKKVNGKMPFIDSITYSNGNITSYRITNNNGLKYDTLTFTYYDNKPASAVYGNQKVFALHGTRIFTTDIDVQAYSRHLLKSVTYRGSSSKTVSFTYEFDDKGNAVKMKKTVYEKATGEEISEYEFRYPCK